MRVCMCVYIYVYISISIYINIYIIEKDTEKKEIFFFNYCNQDVAKE